MNIEFISILHFIRSVLFVPSFCYLLSLRLKILWKTNLGQIVGIHKNNSDCKRPSLGHTKGSDTPENIDRSSCPTCSFKPEDRSEQTKFPLSQTYQNSWHVRRQHFHTDTWQLWENYYHFKRGTVLTKYELDIPIYQQLLLTMHSFLTIIVFNKNK
jgi:hypothetical protein